MKFTVVVNSINSDEEAHAVSRTIVNSLYANGFGIADVTLEEQ